MTIRLGSRVCVRGEGWVVVGCRRYEGCAVLSLEGSDRENAGHHRQLIEPFDRPRTPDCGRPRRRRRDTVVRSALAAAAREKRAGRLWTAADARITLLPYQLEPALSVLDGATRLLLADEVGLGKTIQAGLILSELRARGLMERALILTPAGLRETWAGELHHRFGMDPVVFDQPAVACRAASLPPHLNPWTLKGITIASLDFAKRPEVMAAIEEAPFDVLVADEAHHLTPGSDRGAAVARLASRVPWVVLVSATPHSGDDTAFEYLKDLGALGDRLTIFRRGRADAGIASSRRVHLLAVTPSAAEEDMLRATEGYARAIWQGRGARDRGARLVATTLARRAASSPTALCRTLVRRLALMSGVEDPLVQQPLLPWDELDDGDQDDASAWLGCAGLADPSEERRHLEVLIELARRAEPEASKARRLVRLLARAGEPAVVFTEFRDTLMALAPVVERDRSVAVIHGGLTPAMRQLSVERFTSGGADVLIATDTAGEGLNLHHRCRLVINVELPWNPLRLEQRVGRVDRIGQRRRVHAVELFHRGTIEETVLARLERRRLRARAGLETEQAWTNEDDLGATALGDVPDIIRSAPPIRSIHVARAASEASEAEARRHIRSVIGNRRLPDASWALPSRPSPAARTVILVYAVYLLDSHLHLIEERVVPLAVELLALPTNRREWRRAMAAVANHIRIREVLAADAEQRWQIAVRAWQPLAESVTGRITRIRATLTGGPAPLRQVTLFDRRSELESEARQRVRSTLDARLSELTRRLSHRMLVAPHITTHLVAALPAASIVHARHKA